ncbi:YvrJ family protein [Calderihabitans maritimus]|uniref:Methyl-accepting chemotaxis protein n=1 Tax=Calderihabitans maritimus TaxID=1246530 RepID=A0A1Z5HVC0_9FIRM|nr:YvrJ family protein [Calderihabitans maritimus]GAW93489.1 methyl-accepting chemotaxis protein [Calderihabitans maritimus]
MENLWTQVGNFGFPMVLSIYLLVRVEKKLDELTAAIYRLGQVVEK